ncbi:hypothetical protein H6P81_016648 [Aristolochia fimbriata]|uniref:Uncharacterized protein n=1 Tax=Aristolochia fimbriata TaxID=158543 RepID=A0AAV7EDI8_ARIFI|nr:hypothetical protein H6P81_016648 [Aristolochia fimbriata]
MKNWEIIRGIALITVLVNFIEVAGKRTERVEDLGKVRNGETAYQNMVVPLSHPSKGRSAFTYLDAILFRKSLVIKIAVKNPTKESFRRRCQR